MTNMKNHKYLCQRYTAMLRGIDWQFTFETWWKKWEESGHWENRGCRKGQYVMSRPNDEGPYSPENTIIQLHTDNTKEYLRRPKSEELKQKISITHSGHTAWNKGKKVGPYKRKKRDE